MNILFFNEDVPMPKISEDKIKKWIIRCIQTEKFQPNDINFVFVSDEYLLEMNRQYLAHDYYTDVITFHCCEDKIINGDIFISIQRVEDNAKLYSVNFFNELQRVMIHGVLHLIGYDDQTETEKKQMRQKEDEYLGNF